MVDFRKLDKIWKKRSERSDLEWRIKYIRDACSTLADTCRACAERREPEHILRSFRDAFRSFVRTKMDRSAESFTDSVRGSNSTLDGTSSVGSDTKRPVLLENVITRLCDLCSDLENVKHCNIQSLRDVVVQSSSIADSIRRTVHTAQHNYEAALDSHRRAQHTLDKLRQAVEDRGQCVYSVEKERKLNAASDEEYRTSRNLDVQYDRLQADILAQASCEVAASKLFLKFIECQANALEHMAGLLRRQIPQLRIQVDEYLFRPLFGLCLEIHLLLSHRRIAYVIETCVEMLSSASTLCTEGIFRVTPNSLKLKRMISELDNGKVEDISENYDCHVVAGALKQYLRSLPRSLMSETLAAKQWQDASRMPNESDKIKATRMLIQRLPLTYMENLRYVFQFLCKVVSYQHLNKMTSSNLAICMACSLCFNEKDRKTVSCARSMVALIIDNFDNVFDLPSTSGLRSGSCAVDGRGQGANKEPANGQGDSSSKNSSTRSCKKKPAPPPPRLRFEGCPPEPREGGWRRNGTECEVNGLAEVQGDKHVYERIAEYDVSDLSSRQANACSTKDPDCLQCSGNRSDVDLS